MQCLQELKLRSKVFKETGITCAIEHGVFKSDQAVPADAQKSLKAAVSVLEDIPEALKDYHPSSDEKVLNIVHPSLFPLVYGRSRILKDTEIGLSDCIAACGNGETIPMPSIEDVTVYGLSNFEYEVEHRWSSDFQWLPCNVKFDDQE